MILIETYWNVKQGIRKVSSWRQVVLIETYWNVKADNTGLSPAFWRCINRNILECKVSIGSSFAHSSNSINRNILECKDDFRIVSFLRLSVLIETYWNVKSIINESTSKKTRINRNILECKGMAVILSATSVSVLIETYWNVKTRYRRVYGCIHFWY